MKQYGAETSAGRLKQTKKLIAVFSTVFFLFHFYAGPLFSETKSGEDISHWTKMRMDYAASKEFHPAWDADPDRNAIFSAHEAGRYDEVVRLGGAWLKKCPVDSVIHLAVANAHANLGNKSLSDEHAQASRGLLKSIAASGAGSSEDSAYLVVSIAEVHAVVQSLNGRNVKFSLLPSGIEAVEFQDGNNKARKMYFKYAKEYWDGMSQM